METSSEVTFGSVHLCAVSIKLSDCSNKNEIMSDVPVPYPVDEAAALGNNVILRRRKA